MTESILGGEGRETLSSHKLPKAPGNDHLHQRITMMLGSWLESNPREAEDHIMEEECEQETPCHKN